jgi:ankyrin repeat protein
MFGLTQKEKDKALERAFGGAHRHIDADAFLAALKRGADANAIIDNGYIDMPVLLAVAGKEDKNAVSCLEALLDAGADINIRNRRGATALHMAVLERNYATTEFLLGRGADMQARDEHDRTALDYAISERASDEAVLLVARGALRKGEDERNIAVLCAGIYAGFEEDFVRTVLAKIVNINAGVKNGDVPLVSAAQEVKSGSGIIGLLLEREEIDINARGAEGMTPLIRALWFSRQSAAEKLLRAGADVTIALDDSRTALRYAVFRGYSNVTKTILDAYAAKGETPPDLASALGVAAECGDEKIVRMLIDAHATQGTPPDLSLALETAAINGHAKIVRVLIEAGADVNAADGDGKTILMKAAERNKFTVANELVLAGAGIEAADANGRTAYDHAVAASAESAAAVLGAHRKKAASLVEDQENSDARFSMRGPHVLEVKQGGGLSVIFNFWTQQMIYREANSALPLTGQNFADVQRQEAIEEAWRKLKELGGDPPPLAPGLDKALGFKSRAIAAPGIQSPKN